MQRRTHLLIAVLILLAPCIVRADPIITVNIASEPAFAANGSGIIDVTMTVSENAALSSYSLLFQVDDPYPPDSSLVFVEPVPDYYTEEDPRYVFLGNSIPPFAEVPGSDTTGLQWSAFDIADDSVDLVGGITYLLARLQLQHSYTPDTDPTGDTFTLSLVDDPAQTYFDTGESNDTFKPILIPYNSTPGTITIAAGAVVPEPSAVLMLTGLVVCAAPLLYQRRRKRRC